MKATTKKVFYLILGAILSLVVFVLLTSVPLFFFMFHLGYFPIIELSDILMVYSYCTIISAIVIGSYYLIRKKNIHLAKGFLASLVLVLIILFFNSRELIDILTPQPFNKEVWDSDKSKPLEMVRHITKNKSLVGKTKTEVIEKLGNDVVEEYTDNLRITYHIKGNRITYFQITFDLDKNVKEAYIRYWD